jgi:hypothetical protein
MAYDAAGIIYTRVNSNNTALAISNNGTGDSSSTEPTSLIDGPTPKTGDIATVVGAVVTGDATDFENDGFEEGQYLFYFDATTNAPVLMGQINSVASAISLTLTAAPISTPAGGFANLKLGWANNLITTQESVYMRIPTESAGNGSQRKIPNFKFWRLNNSLNVTAVNNTSQTKLEQYSNPQIPLSIVSPAVNVPFTFEVMNSFAVANVENTYWSTSSVFPTHIWIKMTPTGTTTSTLLSQTIYRFATQEVTESITVGIGTTGAILNAAGYPYSTATGGTGVIVPA